MIKAPLVASAPMLNIATAPLSIVVSEAGGLGLVAICVLKKQSGLSTIARNRTYSTPTPAPDFFQVEVGFFNWGADLASSIVSNRKRYRPCAVWFFAPKTILDDLLPWAKQVGNGLAQPASIITVVPEVKGCRCQASVENHIPLLAAGGIADGRGMAASLVLGALGVVMGTRFLASSEAKIEGGHQVKSFFRVSDGEINNVRSTVYGHVRGILSWPTRYDGRDIINKSYIDATNGMNGEGNKALYEEELKKNDPGFMLG
ncbi:hypothetical protein BJY01DRAFT_241190 [Aspergillus pseudoustus]|uniref:Nitronate monooxygenase domain-containing protein n=1 Tax=Aspergillus pseudoustus TaxID=1810923 RepID=A0ABR4IHU2_9EURO